MTLREANDSLKFTTYWFEAGFYMWFGFLAAGALLAVVAALAAILIMSLIVIGGGSLPTGGLHT